MHHFSMKHAFLPTSSLFYISLIASSYPSLSFRFEILENLKLTKEGISKARARAAPGLPAKGTQRLGRFASTPAKNLPVPQMEASSSQRRPSSHPVSQDGRVSPVSSLSRVREAAAGTSRGCGSITGPSSSAPEHHGSSWPDGRAERDTESSPLPAFHFQSQSFHCNDHSVVSQI